MKKSVMPKLFWYLVSALVLILFFNTVAFADDAAPVVVPVAQTALQNLTDQILAILIPTVVAALGLVATWIGMKIRAKLHLDIADKTLDSWSTLAQSAALRAAEWARTKAKNLEGNTKIPGGDVMNVAVDWAIQMAEMQKLPEMAREKLVGLIESELYKLRLAEQTPATGASQLVLETGKT